MLGREVEERQQRLEVVDDLGDRLGPLAAEVVRERVSRPHGVVAVFGVADLRHIRRAEGCWDFGRAARTLAALWTSCRIRHEVHYAEQRVMPSWDREPLWGKGFGLLKSA